MLRTCLCLLIVFASATVAAREVKLSSPGGTCPGTEAARKPAVVRDNPAPARPAREAKVKPSVHGDSVNPSDNRLQPQRWHSLLPGMFR